MKKKAKANVKPIRQRTQFTCMAASLSMCLQALGIKADENTVNEVMGCSPNRGASWEDALACAQHFGARAILLTPCTINLLKFFTDKGFPVMIAWNPEKRDWSHASVVFDVDSHNNVHIADSNCPDPNETVRIVSSKEFYSSWYEQYPKFLFRRPACVIMPEITKSGKQVIK